MSCGVFSEPVSEIGKMIEEKKAEGKSPVIVSIDGRCASGKTTLGGLLAKQYPDALLLHMDDYYLQPHQRTAKRYAIPGENIDHERFLEQILKPASENRPLILQRLVCPDLVLEEASSVSPSGLIIIEGSYSFHPDLLPYYDLKIFVSTSPKKQLERIEKRNGPAKAEDFKNRWIPLEEKYIAACHPQQKADLQIET